MPKTQNPPAETYADELREVYPNAQLQLVAAEVRYPFAPRLDGAEAIGSFVERLEDDLPIAEPIQEQTVVFGPGGPADVKGHAAFRLASRDRTTMATLAPNRLVLETTDYERYGTFRRLLSKLVDVLADLGRPAGVERVGLRYIDEIRVPEIISSDPAAWRPFMNKALLAPVDLGVEALPDMRPRTWNGLLQFESAEQTTLVVRFGAFEGHAVDPNGALKMKRRTDPGPFFLFDIDSFWNAGEVIATFDAAELMSTWDRLHRPISSVFETCITDRLRNEVLRKET